MTGLVEPCSPQHRMDSCMTLELTAVERMVPVLRDVLKKEMKDLRELKPLHDSLANRLDAASQENAAQFETLREIVKRLSTSLRDKAEVTEVTALVEQHCGDRIDALETACNHLVARISKCEQQCLVHEEHGGGHVPMPKDADNAGDLAKRAAARGDFDELMCSSTSPVKQFSIDTARLDASCNDPSGQVKPELDLMRYECELEQLRCMVLEGQSAIEQLRTAIARERETGVAERARLDGLQKSLADNVVTLSRTHGSVGERLQHMQQMLDDLTNAKLKNHHSSSTEAILGDATTQGLEALRHHHTCLEALRDRLEKMDMSLSERQDNVENMISEENRRIWLAIERHLDSQRTIDASIGAVVQSPDAGHQQHASNTGSFTAAASPPLPPAVVPVASQPPCMSSPLPPRSLGSSAKMVPCGRSDTPSKSPGHHRASSPPLTAAPRGGASASAAPGGSPGHHGASSTPLITAPRGGLSASAPPGGGGSQWQGNSVSTPPPLPPAIRSPAHGGGCGSASPSQILTIDLEPAHTRTHGCSGAVTPMCCTSPSHAVTPTHAGSPSPGYDPGRTPTAVRAGSPTPAEAPMTASPLPTGSRSPSRKQARTPQRPPPSSVMAPPGSANNRGPASSPLMAAQRPAATRSRGGTPNQAVSLQRRVSPQEHASRPLWAPELGGAPRVRG